LPHPTTIAALTLAGLGLAAIVVPAEGQRMPAGPARAEESRSLSLGYASRRGRLRHSAALEPSDLIHVRNPSTRYGTREMVDLLVWAASEVERRHPGSAMLVGDISRRRGGRLRPHRSHRAGRDVDVGFYLLDEDGDPYTDHNHFIRLRADGKGQTRDGTVVQWDDARNWAFVAALMGQDAVPVQYVMAVRPLKERLMEEGRRQGAPAWLLRRVEEAVGPRRTRGSRRSRTYGTHDSHFHVRIYCSADDRPRCRDRQPIWDWVNYPAVEADRGAAARRRRSRARRRRRQRRVNPDSSKPR
jgi:penicillin-insensitive murein endopeptidase